MLCLCGKYVEPVWQVTSGLCGKGIRCLCGTRVVLEKGVVLLRTGSPVAFQLSFRFAKFYRYSRVKCVVGKVKIVDDITYA